MVTASKSWEQPQSYQYDDQGRRISKSVGGKVTNYVYNGQDIIAEYTGTWNQAAASYTHGAGTDQPLIRATATTAQYYHQDGLGSVTAVTDQAGATVGTARNDAWGNKLSGNGGLPQYGYTGREPDETGLVFYRGRYYDPTIGRFTQRDPIGMAGGMNLYAYVGNNPTNFTDPMGTLPQIPTNNASYFDNTGGNPIDTLQTVTVTDTRLPNPLDLGFPTLPSPAQGVVLPTTGITAASQSLAQVAGGGVTQEQRAIINNALGLLSLSSNSGTYEGGRLLDLLSQFNQRNRFFFEETQRETAIAEYVRGTSAEYDYIRINLKNLNKEPFPHLVLPGVLAHEVTHALYRDVGITLSQERRALQNQFDFEISLYNQHLLIDKPRPPTDAQIKRDYHIP